MCFLRWPVMKNSAGLWLSPEFSPRSSVIKKNKHTHPPGGLLHCYVWYTLNRSIPFNNKTADPSVTGSFLKQGFNWLSLTAADSHNVTSVRDWLNLTEGNLWGGAGLKHPFYIFSYHPAFCQLYSTEELINPTSCSWESSPGHGPPGWSKHTSWLSLSGRFGANLEETAILSPGYLSSLIETKSSQVPIMLALGQTHGGRRENKGGFCLLDDNHWPSS